MEKSIFNLGYDRDKRNLSDLCRQVAIFIKIRKKQSDNNK